MSVSFCGFFPSPCLRSSQSKQCTVESSLWCYTFHACAMHFCRLRKHNSATEHLYHQELHEPPPFALGVGECSCLSLNALHKQAHRPALFHALILFLPFSWNAPYCTTWTKFHFSLLDGNTSPFSIYRYFREIPQQSCLRNQILQPFSFISSLPSSGHAAVRTEYSILGLVLSPVN